MPKPTPEHRSTPSPVIEHDAQSLPRSYTAWHQFLARVLEKTRAPGFEVHCFVKLGTLPLEADIILLLLDEHADIRLFAKYFDFLVPTLRPYLVLEFLCAAAHKNSYVAFAVMLHCQSCRRRLNDQAAVYAT